jgi:hypothetical protein
MVMAVATRGMEIAVRAGAEMVEALGKVGAAPAPAEAPGPVLVPVQVPASEHVLVMALMVVATLADERVGAIVGWFVALTRLAPHACAT